MAAPQTSDARCTASGFGSTRSGSHRWVIGATPALKPSGNLRRGAERGVTPGPLPAVACRGGAGADAPSGTGWEGIREDRAAAPNEGGQLRH